MKWIIRKYYDGHKKIQLCNNSKEAKRIKRDFLNVTIRERVKRNIECSISPISKKELIEIILDPEFPISNCQIQKIMPKNTFITNNF